MKKLLILPALLALTVPLAGAGNQASGQTRPNVLFVAIDDLNDWIGRFDKPLPNPIPLKIQFPSNKRHFRSFLTP